MRRGEIWWADLGEPRGSEPGYKHPVLIVSTNAYNESLIKTIVVVPLTSQLRLGGAPGNVLVAKRDTGLPKDSVINVSQVLTVDKNDLLEKIGRLADDKLPLVESGLRGVLGL